MNQPVCIVPCSDYDQSTVSAAFDALLACADLLDWVRPGMTVGIKVNLIAPRRPDAAVTTHPAPVRELCRRLIERGAKVIVGDSPGGLYTPAILERIYQSAGLKCVEEVGASLNYDVSESQKSFPEGHILHEYSFTAWLDRCDAVISFAKLKTHGMMGMTAAVKNLFGVIPGTKKPEYHYLYPNTMDFAHMLVDLCRAVKPTLSLIDGVWGMEGNGPTGGNPRHAGVLLASRDPYACDVLAGALMGITPDGAPLLMAANAQGLAPLSADELDIRGEWKSFVQPDWKKITGETHATFSQNGPLIDRLMQTALRRRPKLDPALCIGCAECAKVCPAHAISMRETAGGKRPRFDYGKCIRCFCCQEFCPRSALIVHRGVIARLLSR